MAILYRKDVSRRRIATIGMFDGVHAGHRFLIDFVCAKGTEYGLTPALVTFAEHPLAVVHPERVPKLITPPDERITMLSNSAATDVVVLGFDRRMSRMSARSFLKMLHRRWNVDALVVGFNHRFGRDRADGFEAYEKIGAELGMKIIAAPESKTAGKPVSSSVIRQYICNGDMSQTADALGREYALRGRVVHGQQIGRKLKYPTANIVPVHTEQIVPGNGVYAARVTTPDGEKRNAMVNIGVRPTVSSSSDRVIEAHIFDYLGYIYDEEVDVEFVERIRGEKRFGSLDALAAQLKKDEKKARGILGAKNQQSDV